MYFCLVGWVTPDDAAHILVAADRNAVEAVTDYDFVVVAIADDAAYVLVSSADFAQVGTVCNITDPGIADNTTQLIRFGIIPYSDVASIDAPIHYGVGAIVVDIAEDAADVCDTCQTAANLDVNITVHTHNR